MNEEAKKLDYEKPQLEDMSKESTRGNGADCRNGSSAAGDCSNGISASGAV